MQPAEIVLSKAGTGLVVSWPDGRVDRLSATVLRSHSRSATEVRRRIDIGKHAAPADVRVDHVEAIGNYALRLHFSDGHDRGIYPWAYLRELAGFPE